MTRFSVFKREESRFSGLVKHPRQPNPRPAPDATAAYITADMRTRATPFTPRRAQSNESRSRASSFSVYMVSIAGKRDDRKAVYDQRRFPQPCEPLMFRQGQCIAWRMSGLRVQCRLVIRFTLHIQTVTGLS